MLALVQIHVNHNLVLLQDAPGLGLVVGSALVKAAMFGSDANWGRVLCAMGYSKAPFRPEFVTYPPASWPERAPRPYRTALRPVRPSG